MQPDLHTHAEPQHRHPERVWDILFWISGFTFIWDFIRLWSEIFMAVCAHVSDFQCDQSRFINLTTGAFKGHFPKTKIKPFYFHVLSLFTTDCCEQYIQPQSNIVCSA